ncbi:MAG: Bacteriocin-protection, YdeI or OmpD-Associated [Thermoplasmata archaeon]|jgi:uncharacterized protein YdeI (YjbR/CyaY-like superfamily)|nr:Bacteriocin-protection, YdeI or OmpD-Associated [Thermoplasmata archaeon]
MPGHPIPPDLASALKRNAAARKHFDALPGKRRERFVTYLDEAKRPATRARRLRGEILQLKAGKSHPRCNWSKAESLG